MLVKFIKPLIVALILYILTVLYGLISFHPLPLIFSRGIRVFLIGFFLSLTLKFVIQYLADNMENGDTTKNNYGNVDNGKMKSKITKNDSGEDIEENKDKEFNPLDPPVLETEDE